MPDIPRISIARAVPVVLIVLFVPVVGPLTLIVPPPEAVKPLPFVVLMANPPPLNAHALVKAVVWRESWFNASARGRKNEFGLMQIRAEAAGEWARAEQLTRFAPEQLFDPATNTLAGAWYLGKLLKRYQKTDNPLPYALADYNAGRSHVLRWNKDAASTNNAVFIEQMDFPSTRKYVKTVMRRYEYYRVPGEVSQK